MLDEVGPNLAVVKTFAEAAQGEVRVGKQRLISLLNDEPIEERCAFDKCALVDLPPVIVETGGDPPCSGQALEIDRGGVAGRVGLMVIDERASLFLLVTQQPVCDFENEIGKVAVSGDVPPAAESLEQPRDLAEMTFVAKAMTVVAEGELQ